MRSILIPRIIKQSLRSSDAIMLEIGAIREKLIDLGTGDPEVSIVIPAFNEEKTILQTLASLAKTKTKRRVEVIVVNNNSNDKTELISMQAGAKCIKEGKQGYMHARNRGLYSAQGKYILNADADTLYPPNWIDQMIDPLESDKKTVLVYGRYAFYPSSKRSRFSYFLYETVSDFVRKQTKKVKDEAAFVMGANSGFIRQLAIAEDGYEHPPEANEDGYMAIKLRKYGKIKFIKESMAWTSDRRLVSEGNLMISSWTRFKKYLARFYYFFRLI